MLDWTQTLYFSPLTQVSRITASISKPTSSEPLLFNQQWNLSNVDTNMYSGTSLIWTQICTVEPRHKYVQWNLSNLDTNMYSGTSLIWTQIGQKHVLILEVEMHSGTWGGKRCPQFRVWNIIHIIQYITAVNFMNDFCLSHAGQKWVYQVNQRVWSSAPSPTR